MRVAHPGPRPEPVVWERILAALLSEGELVADQLHLPGATRDPKDDAIAACAQEGRARYIVSGDQDLLVLGEHKGIQTVTPRQFADLLALL
jgi:predicted nucleic acid-binding protein